MCVRERDVCGEREKKREKEREKEREGIGRCIFI